MKAQGSHTLKGKKSYVVAVAGATGAVGEEMIKILEERKFPVKELKLLASKRSAGKRHSFRGESHIIEELTGHSFKGVDIVLSSAGGSVSRQFSPAAISEGAVVVDNTSAFRMDPEVPLVIPEINPEDIALHKGIIANPNCSTIIMAVPIFPIHKKAGIRRIIVSTYQSVSGAGARAIAELRHQTQEVLEGKPVTREIFPHQIAFNLFSHNSAVKENGYNEEEVKMVNETKKIFHDPKISVTPTCVRVPVYRAHSESIVLELEKRLSVEEAREILRQAPGVRLQDDREKNYFPMPIEASGQDDILVGRIREDLTCPNGLALFVSGDQLRKGAALNAIQIAEKLIAH
ncbi:MAG TPA: aspartate-semialdehyde dehydrogenase [Candidatus Omnitrophota bacterium]|nr:aspartate-semialdehyde dehydrogenase [Candidatus Omnitrophota bacterium]